MERYTVTHADGTVSAVEGVTQQQLLQRLAAYEAMHQALLAERDTIVAEMERLRAAGKQQSVTYQQHLANKMMITSLLDRISLYLP